MTLREQFQAASTKMLADFKSRTTAFEQRLDRGEAREALVREFLHEWLPGRYSYGKGEVVSEQGARSRQTDLIVFDEANAPVLFRQADSPQLFPAESVYGAIEVKSRLDKAAIYDAVEKNAAIKSLPRQRRIHNLGPVATEYDYTPLGAIFAFDSPLSDAALLDSWTMANNEQPWFTRTQIACLLNRGCLMWRPKEESGYRLDARDDQLPMFVHCQGDELLLFYLSLHMWFGQVPSLPVPNLVAYAGEQFTYYVEWAQDFPVTAAHWDDMGDEPGPAPDP